MEPGGLDGKPDAELVTGALSGDEESCRLLVRRYWRTVVGLALCRVRDVHSAEDIAQEVFVRAFQRLETLKDPRCFAGWLCRMTRNRSIDHLRRRSREGLTHLADLSPSQVPPAAPESLNPGLSDDERHLVWKAISGLPQPDQSIVVMRYVNDLAPREIAHRLGRRPGAVRARLHRALKRLRRELAPLEKEVLKS